MTDVEIVIPRFGHYDNLASTVGIVPGGSVQSGEVGNGVGAEVGGE